MKQLKQGREGNDDEAHANKRIKFIAPATPPLTPLPTYDTPHAHAHPPPSFLDESICASIYAYCTERVKISVGGEAHPLYDAALHTPVYVGQTTQTLEARDRKHLSSAKGKFDSQYIDRSSSQYVLVLLKRRTFHATCDAQDMLRQAGEWMDFFEQKNISEFDTYSNGLNSTTGGQGRGWLVAVREAIAKKSLHTFSVKYMPEFRKFHEENKHINVPRSHPLLGRLVCHIRYGHTSIPAEYAETLGQMGLILST